MKIAVIIPVYNMKHCVGNCLASLMKQERKADRIILVDNNSTDGTYEFAQEIIKKDGLDVKLLKENKKGPSPARNRGLKDLDGSDIDIVAFTDADCMPREDWLKNIESLFKENEKAGGIGGGLAGAGGAGIVADSQPLKELNEIQNKAAAMLKAVALAERNLV